MSKYDFQLDMNSDNSNSVILRNIKPNSNVLEFGCAHGRMTKFLKEELNCKTTIVEIDEEAGKVASQWADQYFIGKESNIEQTGFLNYLSEGSKFDYIIFADVLEHLYNPKEVLFFTKSLLAPGGSIWVSIPNISHNSVIIDLLNDKFQYRDLGLLDNTHIRFFTYFSLLEMVEEVGLKVNTMHNLKNTVENTEFKNSYSQVPDLVADYLKQRFHGETYQFVWDLKVR